MTIERHDAGGTAMTVIESTPADLGTLPAQAAERLAVDGAVMVRGLGIEQAAEFHDRVAQFGDPLIDTYRGGNTPRSTLTDGVFSSTEYPARYEITPHNEMSYAHRWPSRLFFGCLTAAQTGGATPVVDGRALLNDLAPQVRARFEEKGVLYRQHLHGGAGLGKSWQQTFETEDRTVVEEFLRDADARFEWTSAGGLRIEQARPAVRTHPGTGETVWFNQADQWHPSNLPDDEAELLLAVVDSEADLPHSAAYGDGTPIPDADLEQVRKAQSHHKLAVPWQPGDLLIIDNMLVLHGREPFTGSRRIVVSMT